MLVLHLLHVMLKNHILATPQADIMEAAELFLAGLGIHWESGPVWGTPVLAALRPCLRHQLPEPSWHSPIL